MSSVTVCLPAPPAPPAPLAPLPRPRPRSLLPLPSSSSLVSNSMTSAGFVDAFPSNDTGCGPAIASLLAWLYSFFPMTGGLTSSPSSSYSKDVLRGAAFGTSASHTSLRSASSSVETRSSFDGGSLAPPGRPRLPLPGFLSSAPDILARPNYLVSQTYFFHCCTHLEYSAALKSLNVNLTDCECC